MFACWFNRLREENTLEVKRAGELVRSLGVEHHIVSLDWGEERKGGRGGGERGRGRILRIPPRSLVITEKKHQSMLGFCQRMNIRTLMIAHHLDDQIGKPGSVCLCGVGWGDNTPA